ncbi:MAG: hypothetical protein QOJ70_440, partial [Acidobacteriota bacterium]|nr:hypothetical protein [Acidobacteriota bacterium]
MWVRRYGNLLLLALLITLLLPNCTRTQNGSTQTPAHSAIIVVRAARMLDVSTGRIVKDASVIVEGERVAAVG